MCDSRGRDTLPTLTALILGDCVFFYLYVNYLGFVWYLLTMLITGKKYNR